jgi:flagellar capping protein FliD
MTSPIADGVMAATQRLVQQAMSGQWNEVPKTVEHRRELLQQLSATASPQDKQWLGALQQAMAESDAAVNAMSQADGVAPMAATTTTDQSAAASAPASPLASSTLEMLRLRR